MGGGTWWICPPLRAPIFDPLVTPPPWFLLFFFPNTLIRSRTPLLSRLTNNKKGTRTASFPSTSLSVLALPSFFFFYSFFFFFSPTHPYPHPHPNLHTHTLLNAAWRLSLPPPPCLIAQLAFFYISLFFPPPTPPLPPHLCFSVPNIP